jgi:hypothetical protein
MIRDRFRHLPGADKIVADHGLEALVAQVAGRRHELAAGIVDQNVEPAAGALDLPHRVFDAGCITDVAGDADRLAAEAADCARAILDRFGTPPEQYEPRPATRHLDCRGTPHPGPSSGHERNLVVEKIGRETHLGQLLHRWRPELRRMKFSRLLTNVSIAGNTS